MKSLVTERLFLFFSVFLKKISINCRFFTQKEHLPAQKKETFCMKKITSYLLRFCKTNSRPLLKKNTYLLQKKEVLIEKLKTVLPALILKKNSWPPTSQNFKTHKTFVVQRFLLHTYTSIYEVYIILLLRDLKTKKVRHQHPHPHPHPQNKKIISVPTTKILIKYKRIKWTPSRKASHLLPGG